MKSEKQIKDEISSVLSEIGEHNKMPTDKSEKMVAKLKKRLAYLKIVLMYIQSNPSKEFCEKERRRLENRINKSMENYTPLDSNRCTKAQCSKHKKEHETLMGVPKIRKHLTTLNYILK